MAKSIRRFGAELKKIAPKLKKEGIYCKSLGKARIERFWEIWVTESATAPDDIKDM